MSTPTPVLIICCTDFKFVFIIRVDKSQKITLIVLKWF
jgi:hypothetical protein